MIRKLQEADINRVATIWFAVNITAHNFISAQYWMDHFEIVQEMFPQAEVYVYEEGAGIQGFIGLQEDYIAGIFVSGEAQSSGIGRRLIHFAKGIRSQLRLDVYQKNIRAVRFYQREGFEISGEHTEQNTGEREYSMIWKRQ